MKTSTVLLLLALSALVLADSKPPGTMAPAVNTDDPPKPQPSTTKPTPTTATTTTTGPTPKPNITTTTAKPAPTTTAKPAPTTTKSTTTTTKSTTTTTKSTTTTTKSTTTTAKPAPTPTKSTTTTTKSTTTTTKSTTATVPPTTTKPPVVTNSTVGNYTLDNGAQRCLMVQMELQIRLVTDKVKKNLLLLPNKTSISGECNDKHAMLTLRGNDLSLTMWFTRNDTKQHITFVERLAFNVTFNSKNSLINAAETYRVDNRSIHLFSAKTGHSYSCRKESLEMQTGLFLDISQERIQAFNFTQSNEFGIADPCPADQGNYRVAIAVGITLLVLVVVVVVAYLLARKKRSDGYQSL